ncbi:Cation or drug efflux system protein [Planktothrix sp. PCC 11201]|uniref:efflux RND transporter permease subunit n=1 Tax=Planktothrix sp. PCC 11201 TaxID=1729650 RepID=UPI0009145393|nr:efflux RND transporter permease subunit [Planktothrix sp. PCC 11201]SKB14501.1 Cation or drug efflux system protein [Planktothrix sp. PCC 11201]
MLLFVQTFIKRPVLTTVCSILIILIGAISIPLLPITQLPNLANTKISITAANIGADAETTETTTTTIIEREINGVEGMKYMSSSTGNNGISNISVYFPNDADRNIAQVNVQNRVGQAESNLPDIVKQTGVTVQASSPNILLVIAFYSDKDETGKPLYDPTFISNYIDLFIVDQISRVPGVGQVTIFGERKYAMRLWLDPSRMAARGLTAQDVIAALREQNVQVGAGKIGQQPTPPGQLFEIPLQAASRLRGAEEFEQLVLKTNDDGSLITVRDVGKAELGAESYDLESTFNGEPAVGLGIYQLPGSNALETSDQIKATIADMSKSFPPGLKNRIAYDTTLFIKVSLEEVVISLLMAVGLVVLVIFIFLQDWRATLIPSIAIPVALIGAMAGLKVFGFELNTLTLFACTLATGLVVDDAIVIVEAVSIKIEQGMKARQAALDAMQELTGATIATSVVLMAVFIPVSFFPGTTGAIYRQFALTIIFALVFSTFNALSFSPSMAGLLLRPKGESHGPLGWFFDRFNQGFGWVQEGYRKFITFLTRINALVMGVFVAGLVATVFMYQLVPSGFVPEEDQGYLLILFRAPDGVSLNYTAKASQQIVDRVLAIPEIESAFVVPGFGFEGQNPSQGIAFVLLKHWEERQNPEQSVYGVLRKLNASLQLIPEVQAFAVNAPPVQGLSTTGGFEFQLLDTTGTLPIQSLVENGNRLIAAANANPTFAGVFSQFSAGKAQKRVEVLRDRAKALNVNINDIFGTLQTYLGSSYVNDFVLGQRQYRVYAQAAPEFRARPEDISQLYVRSQDGEMIALSNLVKLTDFVGPETINHFNIFRSMLIQGNPAPGSSTGQAIAEMEKLASEVLDPGFDYSWQGSALEEKSSGGSAILIFGLAFIMVFLVLSAQYESYIDPTIIMLSVPLAVLGAMAAVWFRSNILMQGTVWPVITNDVYVQVALVMLIGLASKNSILIVEFANQLRDKGLNITQAAIQAAEQRFRPIQMTAISSLIGFWPLVVASGAGSSSRWSLGTAIFGGLLAGTVLSLLITPNLYITIKTLESRFLKGEKSDKSNNNKSDKNNPPSPPEDPHSKGKSSETLAPSDNGSIQPDSSVSKP